MKTDVNWNSRKTASNSARVDNRYTCPNCGAGITGERCEYCGTAFVDFACIKMDEPFFMKVNHNGIIHVFKVCLNSMNVCTSNDGSTLYADNRPVVSLFSPCTTISMDFNVLYENFLKDEEV